MTDPMLRHILLGVCGSSAATAADALVEDAHVHARQISVVATPTAVARFLPPLTVPVYTDADWTDEPLHVTLLRDVDLFMVAPATATTMAKAAAGIADTLLTALILTNGPGVTFHPCMSRRMWDSPAVARAVATLRGDGHYIPQPVPVASLTSDTVGSAVGAVPGTVLAQAVAHAKAVGSRALTSQPRAVRNEDQP